MIIVRATSRCCVVTLNHLQSIPHRSNAVVYEMAGLLLVLRMLLKRQET